MPNNQIFQISLFISISTLTISCSNQTIQKISKPKPTVTIGAVLSTSNIVDLNQINQLSQLLEPEAKNLQFKSDEISNYEEAIAKICNHEWDLSFAFSPVVASQALSCEHTPLHPAFVYNQEPDKANSYFVGFITKKDSPINSLDDIEGKSLALKQKHSASGFYVPLSMLYGKTLAKVGFLGTENEVSRNIITGKYDVGVTAMNTESIMAYGQMNQDLKLIGRSEDIPGGALLVSNRLRAKIGEKDYLNLLHALQQKLVYENAPKIDTKDGNAYLYHPEYPVPDYANFFSNMIEKVDQIGNCYLQTPAKIFNCRSEK